MTDYLRDVMEDLYVYHFLFKQEVTQRGRMQVYPTLAYSDSHHLLCYCSFCFSRRFSFTFMAGHHLLLVKSTLCVTFGPLVLVLLLQRLCSSIGVLGH